MSVNDNLCYELTSNILRTLKLEHLIDKKLSIRDNLQHLLLHKDFIKEFCALHGHKDRSKHMLIEIASQYLDTTSIYTFYENHQLNTNVVKDFNKIFVTYYMQSQIYKEEVDKLIDNEMSYYMYLKELKKLTYNYRKCKEIDDLVNLHKILVRNLSTHSINKVYTNLLQEFRDLYASYISAKPDITQYYHKKISNDTNQNKKKDLLDTIHNLSNTTDSLSKSIDTIFMKPIIHFLSYQTLFTNLQNRSFKNDKTLSFLKNSFIEMTGTINTQMRTDDYEKLYASKRDKIDKIEELESNNTGAIKYMVENELTFRRNLRRYMILFFTNGFAIVSMGRKYVFLEYVDYKRIVKCKIYNEDMMYAVKLVFTGNVREMIVIPIDSEEKAKRIVELTKNREEIVVAKSSYAAKIEFADLLFLIQYSGTESLYAIKKKIIARVGKHFCGDKNIDDDKIDLKLYQNFHFYIRHDGNLYLLENDDDLKAAIMLTEYKLDIVIKNMSDDTNMSSNSNCKI